ncbi:MAG: VanZ family protein [Clostridia bacterium]|nr:VanZ family protein [Clostridia bacterium]
MKRKSNKKIIILTVVICFLYSLSDEIHQHFVPGRACRALDVLIDTSGSAFFCLIYTLITKIFNKKTLE